MHINVQLSQKEPKGNHSFNWMTGVSPYLGILRVLKAMKGSFGFGIILGPDLEVIRTLAKM